ncbi:MAG: metallophosphoesterase family protein [Kiritimatiellaeota bacterium]|nr:metallophosphoesterase family protein [Kiritimatiellota bacterium]
MRYAIFSDVHGNWQAWQAVCADLRAQSADIIVCLGDVIGYGPDPQRVLDDLRRLSGQLLLGNHEAAALGQLDLEIFSPEARRGAEWTATQLDADARMFLGGLPVIIEGDDLLFVHAEPVAPEAWGYVETRADAQLCFLATPQRLTFVGHTHVPEVFTLQPDGRVIQAQPAALTLAAGARYLVNVGSVGDPRDGTAQASYGLYDDGAQTLEFRRVAFDLEALTRALQQHPQLAMPAFATGRGRAAATGERQHALRVPKVSAIPIRIAANRVCLKLKRDLTPAQAGQPAAASQPTYPPSARPIVTVTPKPRRRRTSAAAFLSLAAVLLTAAVIVYVKMRGVRTRPAQQAVRLPPAPEAARPPPAPEATRPPLAPENVLTLTAQAAVLKGKTIRLEKPNALPPHIGFWSLSTDTISWIVPVQRPGQYDVTMVYALARNNGAENFEISCANAILRGRMPPTGSWITFQSAKIGGLALPAGVHQLTIKGKGRIRGGVMNLRSVSLQRVP